MSPVLTARSRQTLSETWAVRGNSSEIHMPGVRVSIGPNCPRTSAGASGFGSQVECWGGPPIRNRTMQDFARPEEAREADPSATWASGPISKPAIPAPSTPRLPTRIISRRETLSQSLDPGPTIRNMGASLPLGEFEDNTC